MSERQAKAPTMSALLPSRLVPEDMLSEWQGPNLPNTKNYAPAEDSIGGMIRNALLSGVAGVGGFTGLPMSDEGNRAALLGELLAAGMPLVGGVKQLAKLVGAENKVAQGIKAYHGSPHDFDQFSLSKIGTGEGNQSYLRGLYFAENENVATDYRNALAPQFEVGGKPVVSAAQIRNDPKAINRVQDLWGYINSLKMDDLGSAKLYAARLDAMESTSDEMRQLMDSWQRVKAAPTGQINKGRGHMYEVNIDADPEDFLDWDAPLSQQSEKVRQKLPTYLQPQEGENMGDALRRIRMDEDPEEGLRAAGIQGIKYLDEGSRGPSFRVGLLKDRIAREKAQGLPFDHWQQELDALEKTQSTRNYVVFDDKLISIVKKYGIAGALSAGAINELEARQLQAQGYQ